MCIGACEWMSKWVCLMNGNKNRITKLELRKSPHASLSSFSIRTQFLGSAHGRTHTHRMVGSMQMLQSCKPFRSVLSFFVRRCCCYWNMCLRIDLEITFLEGWLRILIQPYSIRCHQKWILCVFFFSAFLKPIFCYWIDWRFWSFDLFRNKKEWNFFFLFSYFMKRVAWKKWRLVIDRSSWWQMFFILSLLRSSGLTIIGDNVQWSVWIHIFLSFSSNCMQFSMERVLNVWTYGGGGGTNKSLVACATHSTFIYYHSFVIYESTSIVIMAKRQFLQNKMCLTQWREWTL